ncbi:MFS transporter [Paraburkholderia hospita]|uniref:MFS transporter n=1 Tax=Paraburkholderia hospita TaxID=169430 RepID=A0AAN1JH94_9BURK|nr:MFS transporter [Paraburkholderia hospita]AUT73293.1 MFS transporter [Paraburkholderia hospita]EIM98756.1 major facilitator superfamily protein [Paraburkholderia hospita]OUL93912.1 MFS transporter [Paraburkholderia hospita]OUL95374.1 MFS transporter [Paraburkholderia hospita]SEH79132.1 Sugar phosphate permease [Paraburkholderia hospita]
MSATPDHEQAPPKIRRAQIVALTLLMVSGIVNYLDRGTLAVANPLIRHDLGLSLGQMGLLLSAFSWSYALFQLPVGGLVDRIGPRKLLGIGLIVWSLAQAAGGFVSTFGWFILARIVLGIGEAPQFPSAARVVSNWFPLRARGKPTGIFNSASPLGTALAPLCLSILVVNFHWRWAFIVTGIVGLFVAVVWLAVYRDPVKATMTEEERRYLEGDEADRKPAPSLTFAEWRSLFSHGTTWGMLIGFFGSVYLNWVYLTWLPGYLTMERHMSLMHTGVAASIPFFCGFLGSLTAGWFSDLMTSRSTNPVGSRRNAVVIAMLGMVAFTIPAALVESNTIAIACISVVIFLANAASASSWALATAAAPPNRIGSLGAIQNFGGFLGGALAPILTGYIAQNWSFVPALLTAAGIAFVGAMSYVLFVRKPIEDKPAHVEAIRAQA